MEELLLDCSEGCITACIYSKATDCTLKGVSFMTYNIYRNKAVEKCAHDSQSERFQILSVIQVNIRSIDFSMLAMYLWYYGTTQCSSAAALSTLVLLSSGARQFFVVEGYPVHHGMFRITSCQKHSPPPITVAKNVSQYPWGDRTAPGGQSPL